MEIPEYSDSTDPSDLEYYYSPTAEREEQEEKIKTEEGLKQEQSSKLPKLSEEEKKIRLRALREDYPRSFIHGGTLVSEFK